MSKLRLIYAFIKLKQGKVLKLKQTFHYTLSEIKIDKTKPYTVNVDGELYENIPFEVKVVSNTLKFYR
jgi:diacylglycerol kinase family enzyme